MTEDRKKQAPGSAYWLGPSFWDEVEFEIEATDLNDFVEFVEAESLPIEARPGFREKLLTKLRDFVRTRYTS